MYGVYMGDKNVRRRRDRDRCNVSDTAAPKPYRLRYILAVSILPWEPEVGHPWGPPFPLPLDPDDPGRLQPP
jgi:hypothetical protein